MFTVIPTGIVSADATGTHASLSVLVSPQVAGTSLAAVPAFADWPSVASTLAFSVQFRGTASTDPHAPAALDLNPKYAANRFDSALWTAIFGASAVTPWSVQNMTSTGVLSYDAKKVSDVVKSVYQSTSALTSRPRVTSNGTDALSRRMQDIAGVVPHGAAIGSTVKSRVGQVDPQTGKVAVSLSSSAVKSLQTSGALTSAFPESPEFARVAAFHNRDNYRQLGAARALGKVKDAPPAIDFHRIIGQLADHPVILRRLGLVIDLVVVLPAGLEGPTSLFVQPTAPIAGVLVNHPWTHTMIHLFGSGSPPAFRPVYGDADAGSTVRPFIDSNGLVCVDDPQVSHVDDLDIDHAAGEISNASAKVAADLQATPPVNGVSAVDATMPALRTGGLAVYQTDREGKVGLRFQEASEWNPSGAIFVAENLVRGYRVDVRTAGAPGGAWSSLCLRTTSFTFTGGHAPITVAAPDEGYVKASAMSVASDDTSIHSVGESLFHWDGWSLVASRPGLVVGSTVTATGAPAEGPVAPTSNGAAAGLPFTTRVVAQPGTLPKLRLGTSYELRVRAVDLCGNDMLGAASGNTNARVSAAKRFTRYEPVSPPVIQLRRPVTEGESNEHLVIRSDPYGPTKVYADAWAAKNNVAPPGAPAGAPATTGMGTFYATCERHVAPPKTSVQLAEYHGAIDSAVVAAAPGRPRATAAWSIVSKEDGNFYDRYVTDSTTGQYRTVEQPGRAIVTPPFSAPLVALALASGQPAFIGNQEIVPRGSALQSGQYVVFDADSLLLPYLPDPNATGIALQGLGATPMFRSYAPRAANVSGGAWPELATFRLVVNESRAGLVFSGVSPVPGGASGPVTVSLPPATVLEVAYSSTIADPTLHSFGPASASDPALVSAQRGLLPAIAPRRTLTLVHAVQRPMAPVLADGDVSVDLRAEGDTSQTVHANLTYDGPSTGRVDVVASWVEYVDVIDPASPALDPSTNPVPHSGIVTSFTPGAADRGSLQTVRQMFGDTKRRDVTYSAIATTRFREYFPATITADSSNITTSATAPTAVVCRSSARPPTPRVLYAVPSFAFDKTTSGATSTRTRRGGIVRVYCDRGWFASGADERLGVVLAPSAATKLPNLVSVWGPDPIWYRGTLKALDVGHLRASDIAEVVFGMPLAEGAGAVNVATYKPSFNAARGLWYFDIGIATDDAYFPFLRLALVRYQPQSVGTLHVSPVVCTEFVQLAADRTASVVSQASGNYAVSLSGVTAPNLASAGVSPTQFASGHYVTAEFQEATTSTPDPIDWVTLGQPVVMAPTQLNGVSVAYQANLVFPAASALPGSKHRILLREYEVFAADLQDGVREGVGVVQIGQPTTSYRTRLVYTDAIAISA